MFYADLPETLGRAVVGQLEANGALKLFILGGDRDIQLQADSALEDTTGWDLPCQGPPVPPTGAVTMRKKVFKAVLERSMPSPTEWSCPHTFGLNTFCNCFSVQDKLPQETNPLYSSFW